MRYQVTCVRQDVKLLFDARVTSHSNGKARVGIKADERVASRGEGCLPSEALLATKSTGSRALLTRPAPAH